MVADVPVGVLLSGGIDSSLVVALLADAGQSDLTTFSIGFEAAGGESGDEFEYSDLVAKQFGTQPPPDPRSRQRRLLPAVDARHRGDERADGQPRLRGVLSCSREEVSQDGQGRAVRPGRGRGASPATTGTRRWPRCRARTRPRPTAASSSTAATPRCDALLQPELACSATIRPRTFVADHFARARGRDRARRGAAASTRTIMLVDDPVKRVDNMTMAWGLEARVPVPRSRAGRARRPPARPSSSWPTAARACLKRAAAGCVPGRGHRPHEGLLPGAGDPPPRGSVPRAGDGTR